MMPTVVFVLLANGFDLIMTLWWKGWGLANEANPFMAYLFGISVYVAIMVKILGTFGATFILWKTWKDKYPKLLDGVLIVAGGIALIAPLGGMSWLY